MRYKKTTVDAKLDPRSPLYGLMNNMKLEASSWVNYRNKNFKGTDDTVGLTTLGQQKDILF